MPDTTALRDWLDLLVKIVFVPLVGLCVWGVTELASLDKRLSIAETKQESRREADKGRDLQRAAVAKALGDIKSSVDRNGATMRAEQKATQDRLGRIEARLPR